MTRNQQIELFGRACHGYFEAIWIENGKVDYLYQDNNRSSELVKFKQYLWTK